jgi:hypothetical protein
MQEASPSRSLSPYINAPVHGQMPLFYHLQLELCPFPPNPLVYSFHCFF